MASDPQQNQSINREDEIRKSHERKIRKAFNNLKKHASIVANFALLWQDLEDHIASIKAQIESQITHYQSRDSTPIEPTLHQLNEKDSVFDLETNQMEPSVFKDSNFNVPTDSGKTLLMYMSENDRYRVKLRERIGFALKDSEDCGKLVLEAINVYLDNLGGENTILGYSVAVVRRSCIILLEELIGVGVSIDEEVKGDARRLVFEWKKKLVISERRVRDVQLFFMVLGAFGLVNEFEESWIIKAFDCVVFIKEAPSVFIWLGFGDKAPDYIERLLSHKRYLIAIAFVCAFEMHDKYPPVSLIEDHLDKAKREVDFILKKGENSAGALEDAADSELRALKAAWKCIQRHKLRLQYPIKNIKERRKQIKAWKRDMIKAMESRVPQQHLGRKHLCGTSMTEDSLNGYATSSSSPDIKEEPDNYGGDSYVSLDADNETEPVARDKNALKPSLHRTCAGRCMPSSGYGREWSFSHQRTDGFHSFAGNHFEDRSSHGQYEASGSTYSRFPLTSITSVPPDMRSTSSYHDATTVPHISTYAHSSGYSERKTVLNRHSRQYDLPGVTSHRSAMNGRRHGFGGIPPPGGITHVHSRAPYSHQPKDHPLPRDDCDRIVIL